MIDLTGRRFGRLVALHRTPNQGRWVMWRCACDCGKTTAARSHDLMRGGTRSCGCWRGRSYATHSTPERSAAAGRHTQRRQTLDEAWAEVLAHCAAGLAEAAKMARRSHAGAER